MATNFSERCYKALKRVPRGKVTTYRELARSVGTKAYRAVGQVMKRNPNAPKVPCHRVVKSDGKIGGYAKGSKTKERMLKREGIKIVNGRVSDLKQFLYRF